MKVALTVYDVLGRRIATLVDRQQEAGIYEVAFQAGGLPPGLYVYRITMDHPRYAKTMILMR